MQRVWAAVLTLVLVAGGFVPELGVGACCQKDSSHSCCAPAATLSAGCCDQARESSAIAPAVQRDAAVTARGAVGPEIAALILPERASAYGAANRPVVHQSPPIILRI